ncbi:MAG: Lrp/AsnC family transcriptional regulator [Planctomycetia bacterium]|nr:AsnC family transcriptional regulator [Candidatus Brocadia sp.]QOJ06131.1 MAG: Lrp/AsnC family transcriptional regulator [Planctomycetia bacterium]TVL96306.1 MAG: Lrp/AsnC family transcriptional regulator [Candidatus Brocadia sp. BL1]HQU30504.1 AsnC family transcriptional regulator [Candidatus Brocadia sapporoensis]
MILTETDRKILHRLQSNIPLLSRPFLELGKELDIDEDTIIERIKFMVEKGYIRRLAPIINTQAMGREATLAAVKVPEERIDEVSAIINEYSGVSHNYLRKGKNKHIPYNVWFTMSAKDDEELHSRLKEIETRIGLTVRTLPTAKKFKIGVRFKIY